MTTLVAGKTVSGSDSKLLVENRLDPGTYVFTLTVVDNDGNESAPAQLSVVVKRTLTPVQAPRRASPRRRRPAKRPDSGAPS